MLRAGVGLMNPELRFLSDKVPLAVPEIFTSYRWRSKHIDVDS